MEPVPSTGGGEGRVFFACATTSIAYAFPKPGTTDKKENHKPRDHDLFILAANSDVPLQVAT